MLVLWCVPAALYGGLAVLLLQRAAYRLSVEPDQPWRVNCPQGHRLPHGPPGWAGWGRCSECAASYGPDPPLVVGSVAVAAAAAGSLPAVAGTWSPELVVWLLLVPLWLLLAVVDLRVRRLPDVLTLPMAVGTALVLGLVELLPGEAGSWAGAALGSLVLAGFYGVLFLINPDGMGFGDVKLALTVGLVLGWYGWGVLFAGTLAGLVLGAVAALALIAKDRANRHVAMPFGPFLLAGAWAGVLFGASAG